MATQTSFKLGVFAPNCSGGAAITRVPERWRATWDENIALAKLLDEHGMDFILPIARWRSFGGETEFQRDSFETLSWSAGMLAATRRIHVFGTAHVALIHPIFAARQMATLHHLGAGRFGLNIVCGWNKDEFEMFGQQMLEHDDRYEYGEEWWNIVKDLWTQEGELDFDGKYLKLKRAVCYPKPYGGKRPAVINAGASSRGKAFGARNCDSLFTVIVDPPKAKAAADEIHSLARSFGRSIGILGTCYVVCRPTRKEAEEYHHYYAEEMADWPAAEKLMKDAGIETRAFPPEYYNRFRVRFSGGHGSFPLIGAPDDVAQSLAQLAAAGYAGTTVSFVNYLREFPYFAQEVLPRLERLGLRAPVGGGDQSAVDF